MPDIETCSDTFIYLCDQGICDPERCAMSGCKHTTDISHAVNRDKGDIVFIKLAEGVWLESEGDAIVVSVKDLERKGKC